MYVISQLIYVSLSTLHELSEKIIVMLLYTPSKHLVNVDILSMHEHEGVGPSGIPSQPGRPIECGNGSPQCSPRRGGGPSVVGRSGRTGGGLVILNFVLGKFEGVFVAVMVSSSWLAH